MNIKLRYMLAVAFTVIATVPVLFLGAWVQKTSLEKELAAVREKHLLLADNMTAALERYAKDTQAAFNLFVALAQRNEPPGAFKDLARQLGFRDFRCLDSEGRLLKPVEVTGAPLSEIAPAMVEEIRQDLAMRGRSERGRLDKIIFSRVVNDALGRPTIYLAQRLDPHRIAIGSLETTYIVQLQKAIAFGRKGHAAIVDHLGNLIAHPKSDWARDHKNIAKLEPVRRMMAGETGVASFYSPAMQEDMISGFTVTPGPGWGVMVPQPMSELEEQAGSVRFAAFAFGLAGLATAAVIGWFIAGLVTLPVQEVLSAARDIGEGRLTARVARLSSFVPGEFRDLAEGFNGMAGIIQDDKAALLRAIEEVQLADRAKSEFMAGMSHELRTPLNAIIGFSEVIEAGIFGPVGDPRYQDYAHNIRESGIHLLAIINDILDLSKIEAGKLEVEDGLIDTDRMIRGALMLIDERARASQIALGYEPTVKLPALRGSEVKLKQVLVNLLSNAVKFTPSGGRVTLSAWREPDGGLAIRVADNGIGMSKDEVVIALMPFRQLDGRLNRRYEGTGLGLPLAKRLTELHGGTLEIESVPDRGTRVTLRLGPERVLAAAA